MRKIMFTINTGFAGAVHWDDTPDDEIDAYLAELVASRIESYWKETE